MHRRLVGFLISSLLAGWLLPAAALASEEYVLTVSRGGSGMGSVASQGLEIDCSGTCTHTYPADTQVILSATADGDSIFTGWSGDCGGGDSCLVTMDQARSVTAHFATPCATGSYSNFGDDRAGGCAPAPAGHYVDLPGATGPSECALGTYQPSTGQDSCIEADAGHYVGETGSSVQTACAAGTYEPETRSSSCIPASLGYYVSATGASTQTKCPIGTTTASTGSTSAAACSTTAPTVSNVLASLHTGVPSSAPMTVDWSATDDLTADANLVHQVESRRLKDGAWSSWVLRATLTGSEHRATPLAYDSYVQFRIRTRDQAGRWSGWVDSTPFRMVALRTPSFGFAGPWSRVSGNAWGIVRRSSKPGSMATLNFVGTAVGAVLRGASGQGTVHVCVDPGTEHAECKTVNLGTFSPSGGRVIASAFNDLAPGTHVLRVSVVSGSIDLLGAVVKTAQTL